VSFLNKPLFFLAAKNPKRRRRGAQGQMKAQVRTSGAAAPFRQTLKEEKQKQNVALPAGSIYAPWKGRWSFLGKLLALFKDVSFFLRRTAAARAQNRHQRL
jgi:hypothetical protein